MYIRFAKKSATDSSRTRSSIVILKIDSLDNIFWILFPNRWDKQNAHHTFNTSCA